MSIRREVLPFIGIAIVIGLCAGLIFNITAGSVAALAGTAFLLFFFRDPERNPPRDRRAVLSGADGRVMSVTKVMETIYMKVECMRVSVFLSVFDAHVNRSPISGYSTFLGYFPGKKYFAFQEKSSEFNQNNKILIENPNMRCLVVQIVGPVARRVVYWLDHMLPAPVRAGDRIGMMKFGSRLDIYLPSAEADVLVVPGARVRAGETVIARIKSDKIADLK
jgi:phosphatidylserine decarboxylase